MSFDSLILRRPSTAKLSPLLLAAGLFVGPLLLSTTTIADPAMLASADPGRVDAKQLKKCAKCHGDEGVSDDPEVPHLAGQSAAYMYKQLQDFKADAREGGRMNKTAKKLSDQEMADLVALYAGKSLPEEAGVSVPDAPALVSAGDAARGIDSCADCHGADGRGKKDKYEAPALAGMPKLFFTTTMKAFRSGERANDADGVMGKAAKQLSDDEIASLAGYYLALGKRKALPE
ncbi:MAG: c-type cytochrome [Gammaproteobacteria bacterium]|nr:c-type cytochrome [Gammaproteobacteria bacterium]